MNEFCITDSEGVVHWIRTCSMCRCLVERDQMTEHINQCARVHYISSPVYTGIPA